MSWSWIFGSSLLDHALMFVRCLGCAFALWALNTHTKTKQHKTKTDPTTIPSGKQHLLPTLTKVFIRYGKGLPSICMSRRNNCQLGVLNYRMMRAPNLRNFATLPSLTPSLLFTGPLLFHATYVFSCLLSWHGPRMVNVSMYTYIHSPS